VKVKDKNRIHFLNFINFSICELPEIDQDASSSNVPIRTQTDGVGLNQYQTQETTQKENTFENPDYDIVESWV